MRCQNLFKTKRGKYFKMLSADVMARHGWNIGDSILNIKALHSG